MGADCLSIKCIVRVLAIALVAVYIAGCGQPGPASVATVALSSPSPEPRPTLLPQRFVLPNWAELKLPSGCQFERLSWNLQWLTYFCDPGPSKAYEGWLAQISAGQIKNPKFLGHMGRRLGFTPDSSGLIVKREDGTWWLIHLSGLTEQPYLFGTFEVPDTLYLEGGLWSPDYSQVALGDIVRGDIFVLTPSARTLDEIVEGTTPNAGLFSWSPDGQEIAYIEGFPTFGDGIMAARIVNVQSKQSRTLLKDKLIKTGASWSPDGKWTAVRAEDQGARKTMLWFLDPQGGSPLKFEYDWIGADVLYGWRDLVWSPDNSQLALRGQNLQGDFGILIVQVPSGKVVSQVKEYGKPLGWSADSTLLLIQTYDVEAKRDILRWVTVR